MVPYFLALLNPDVSEVLRVSLERKACSWFPLEQRKGFLARWIGMVMMLHLGTWRRSVETLVPGFCPSANSLAACWVTGEATGGKLLPWRLRVTDPETLSIFLGL